MLLAKPVKVAIDTVVSGVDAQLAKGSSVTGRVTNTQAEGLPRVIVNGYSSLTDEYPNATTTTDNSGYYTLTSLAAGAYFIKFTPGFYDYNTEYARQYYNDKTHRRVANVVTVAANSIVPNINAVLKPHPGEIRGRVTDATGKGLEDVFVYAYYNQVEAGVASTKSDVNGVYTLTRLSPGSYYLYFDARQGSYLDESYNNQRNFSDAEPVTVAASTPTQNINATLGQGGTITGQILLADGTPAIDAEITVEAKPGLGFVRERTTTTHRCGK